MCLRGKRWRKAWDHQPDENKWTASWWEEQRQRRWNWLNQSFILFPPIYCAVIGVRVTGRLTPSSPTCLDTYTCPHIHLYYQTRLCLLCSGSWGKRLWLGLTNGGRTQAFIYWRGRNLYRSSGRLPRWFFNFNTPQMARVALSFVAKNLHVSHSTWGVTQSVNQSEAFDFVKWLLRFLSHLHRRYMRSKIQLSRWGNTGYKSQPSWHSCPLVEEETRECSWVRVIQPDWMSASWTPGKGNGTSIIQQKDGENLWQKLQQIDHE